jgi:hypothetical protein
VHRVILSLFNVMDELLAIREYLVNSETQIFFAAKSPHAAGLIPKEKGELLLF